MQSKLFFIDIFLSKYDKYRHIGDANYENITNLLVIDKATMRLQWGPKRNNEVKIM